LEGGTISKSILAILIGFRPKISVSDRAYGKLKERVEYEVSEFRGTSDDDLQRRITELELDLGLVHQIDEAD
jgi:hypothetical protein